MSDLENLPSLAADYIDTHGFVRHGERADDGSVSLTGALRFCATKYGDWLVSRAVFRSLNRAEDWNDMLLRSKDDVVSVLRSTKITESVLFRTFGPQWETVISVAQSVQARDRDQALASGAAEDDLPVSIPVTISRDIQAATLGEVLPNTAWDIAMPTFGVHLLRDYIGSSGFTQAHYDILTAPWGYYAKGTKPAPSCRVMHAHAAGEKCAGLCVYVRAKKREPMMDLRYGPVGA